MGSAIDDVETGLYECVVYQYLLTLKYGSLHTDGTRKTNEREPDLKVSRYVHTVTYCGTGFKTRMVRFQYTDITNTIEL